MELDAYGQLKPGGPSSWKRCRSASLARTCPFSPRAANEDEISTELFPGARVIDPKVGRFDEAYVGHVAEEGFRDRGSSGGMVSWMLAELRRTGVIDRAAHVRACEDPRREGRFFKYVISTTEEEIRSGAKSRYYPVDMSEILRAIRSLPGRYAVVGVPCFVKAVQLLRREDPVIRERVVVTLGLFCGHMKSARMVESFAWQMGVRVEDVRRIEYRIKDPSRPATTYTAELTLNDGRIVRRDWWNLVEGDWGSGFFQYNACNYCDDVVAETADVSFGDAWVEPYASDGRGTNVVVVRSRAVGKLISAAIEKGRLALTPVDARFIEQTQAAGFRQRREGLAYRLSWGSYDLPIRKRVRPDPASEPRRRRLIYRMRAHISAWSHRVFRLARLLRVPSLYIGWGRAVVTVYHGLAYSRGRIGEFVGRWLLADR